MKIKEFVGSTVLDKNANVVGKIDNVDFDTETGKIGTIILTLQKDLFSRDELEKVVEQTGYKLVSYDSGAYVILNKEISNEAVEEEVKTTTVEIEDE